MDSLYVGQGLSEWQVEKISEKFGVNPGYAGHKFGRLILKGMSQNGVNMKSFSAISVNRQLSKKIFWNLPNENENGIGYIYMPVINIPIIKQLGIVIYTFFYILFWGAFRKKDRFVFVDVINTSLSLGTLAACWITRVKVIGCMTDMPGLMVDSSYTSTSNHIFVKYAKWVNSKIIGSFDAYVFLTEQMNYAININNRPYIIMEGLVDINQGSSSQVSDNSGSIRTLFYAGGLHERYGLKMLVDGFHSLKSKDYRLVIYGSGPYTEQLKKVCVTDNRIEFRGIAANDVVVREEMNASVLINPRPTHEEFTKYSFPSKNMEYMVSGRPLLTTALPGMPAEYYDYVYILNCESTEGYAQKIDEILSLSEDTLNQKGDRARQWILKNKNNTIQTKRIIDLVKSVDKQ